MEIEGILSAAMDKDDPTWLRSVVAAFQGKAGLDLEHVYHMAAAAARERGHNPPDLHQLMQGA
jgi:hypothetical protein